MENKITTKIIPPMTINGPIENRKYTLTHSDITGELFLTISSTYDYEAIDKKLRDEVIGKWKLNKYNNYDLILYVYINADNYEKASKIYRIFEENLPLAIKGILYGDIKLIENNPKLKNAQIFVNFISVFPQLTNKKSYGYVSDYIK